MSEKSAIEWTDSTWNPVTGCSKVSEGCRNCYAETISLRFGRSRKPWSAQFAAENVVLHADRLDYPLKWKEPRMVFVNSMSDLFHELVPDSFITQVFRVMGQAPQHTFQVLTKRPDRMRSMLKAWTARYSMRMVENGDVAGRWPRPNIWLGTSVEDDRVRGRLDDLRDVPSAIRFVSFEPLLGPLPDLDLTGIHWVIVGGESGPRHRPMDLAWARDIRDQCQSAGVPFFFKQVGGRTPKAGGRELDGKTWDEMPLRVDAGAMVTI